MISTSELADRFASGATKGEASRVYIEGDTIYSYGRHFPIAKRIGPKEVLFNTDKYSMSTARHKRYVWNALSSAGFKIWDVYGCDLSAVSGDFIVEVKGLHVNILVAKKKLPEYLGELKSLKKEWEKLKKRFGLNSAELDFLFTFMTKDAIASIDTARRLLEAA